MLFVVVIHLIVFFNRIMLLNIYSYISIYYLGFDSILQYGTTLFWSLKFRLNYEPKINIQT